MTALLSIFLFVLFFSPSFYSSPTGAMTWLCSLNTLNVHSHLQQWFGVKWAYTLAAKTCQNLFRRLPQNIKCSTTEYISLCHYFRFCIRQLFAQRPEFFRCCVKELVLGLAYELVWTSQVTYKCRTNIIYLGK